MRLSRFSALASIASASLTGLRSTTWLGALALATVLGATACSEPSTTGSPSKTADDANKVKVENGHSYRVAASASTKSSLGVASWHILTEPGTQSVVLEGVDGKGVVKFASSFRGADDEVRVESYRGPRGTMTLVTAGNKLKSGESTIALSPWKKHLKSFVSDAQNGKVVTEYAKKKASPKPQQQPQQPQQPNIQVQGPSGTVNAPNKPSQGNSGGQNQQCTAWIFCSNTINNSSNAVQGMSDLTQQASQATETGAAGDDALAGGAEGDELNDGAENGDGAENEDGAENGDGAENEDGAENGDAENGDAENGDAENGDAENGDEPGDEDGAGDGMDDFGDEGELEAESGDEALDDNFADEGGGDEGADFGDEGGGDEGGGDEGGGDEGGGDEGAADEGGGGGEEFALHNKCQHLSCSKTSKICICAKY